jgi:TetR/AcrR family transcriptional regulator, regulator of autoinduction and epiphytic fitness
VPAVGETSVTAEPSEPVDASAHQAAGKPAAVPRDGRASRAARTRLAVVDALLRLNNRGQLRPTARDIATEAGVSLRSLYVHFDDLEALFVAASQRYTEKLSAALAPPVGEGPLADRLDSFVERRAFIHEFGAGSRRAARLQEPFSPALQQAIRAGGKALRADVRYCFGPEIAAAGEEGGRGLVAALDVVTGSQVWDAMRVHQDLSAAEATAQLRDMISAFIARWAPDSSDPDPAEPHSTEPASAGPESTDHTTAAAGPQG